MDYNNYRFMIIKFFTIELKKTASSANIPVVTSAKIDISEIKTHKTLKTQKFSF